MACRQLNYACTSEKENNRSIGICYLKAMEGQVSLPTVFRTLRVCISGSFFGYFDDLERSTF